jgi:hypothetical protein
VTDPKPILNQGGHKYRLIPYEVDPRVACGFCGGFVRGHQWISTDTCSLYPPRAEGCAELRDSTGSLRCQDPRCQLCWGP